MFGLLRRFRRRRLARKPFPDAWRGLLREGAPFYAELAESQRERFETLLKVFIHEKHFIGAKGFEITDQVRVLVAAAAVRLVLHLDLSFYDRLTEIVIHPSHYRHEDKEGIVFGEAQDWGTVVLSWDAVVHGMKNTKDGHDTALHEFAHVLDRQDGAFDGTPKLPSLRAYGPWAQVMSHHYLALRKRRKSQRRVLRSYGATNEAEFFAVATEAFFEKPDQLKKRLPDLYEALAEFYRTPDE